MMALSFFLICFSVPQYLTKIDINPPERIYEVADKGVCVVEQMDGYCLALTDEAELRSLNAKGFSLTVLDNDPRGHAYYLVYPAPWVPYDAVKPYGDILNYDGRVVLLRTIEDNVRLLNGMQVELKRVFLRPIVIRRETSSPAPTLLPDTLVQAMVQAVLPESIRASIYRMQRMKPRNATGDSARVCAQWLANRLRAYGCDSVYLQTWNAAYAPNVIGIRRGVVTGLKNYAAICGHYDGVVISPAADDNATGTTAALEAARVMNGYVFEKTVRYIAFSAEENGMLGSEAYCANAQSSGDTVICAFDFEMLGYATTDTTSLKINNSSSVPGTMQFVDFFIACADTYVSHRVVKATIPGGSDYQAFWDYGYCSTCSWESILCPGYHTAADSIGPQGVNSIPYCTKNIKAAVATLTKLAHPLGHVNIEDPSVARQEIPPRAINAYPNPASGRITFELPRLQSASPRIYSAAGQRVLSLPMRTVVVWNCRGADGKKLPAGVYFVEADIDSGTLRARIVLY
jgi:aminopeptidase YwaD